MVTVDADHPDIEEYISWKVLEEQKVASWSLPKGLCQAQKATRKHATHQRIKACSLTFLSQRKQKLRAKQSVPHAAPDNYIYRVIQFARQGYSDIEFPTYNTDWDSDAYLTVSGQNSNNSVRVTHELLQRALDDGDWNLIPRRTDGDVSKTIKARDLWEQQLALRLGKAQILVCSTTADQRMGTPAPNQNASTLLTHVQNTCSWTTPPVTWHH